MSRTVTAAGSLVVLALLTACGGPRFFARWSSGISRHAGRAEASLLDATQLDATLEPGMTVLKWSSRNFPTDSPMHHVRLSLAPAEGSSQQESFWLPLKDEEHIREGGDAPLLALTRPFGGLTFRGTRADEECNGTLEIRVSAKELDHLTTAGWNPTVRQAIRLIAADVPARDVAAVRKINPTASLRLSRTLAQHHVPHAAYRQLVDDEFAYDDDDVIKLVRHRIDLDVPSAWKATGRALSADEVIYCRQRRLSPADARAWDAVDTELTIKQLYWAKQRRVAAKQHAEWQRAGGTLSLKQLYWANQRRIDPSDYSEWKAAGRPLDLKQLYWVQQRRIAAADHRAWADIGQELTLENLYWTKQVRLSADLAKSWSDLDYKWTIKQMYTLKNRRITPRFASGFIEAGFQNPSLDELVRYRNMNLKPADVRKLRRRKSVEK